MALDEKHFKNVCIEIKRHLEDAETSKLAHWYAASIYGKRHMLFIGLPATIFSIILTWLLSSNSQEFISNLPATLKTIVLHTPVFLGLMVSILSGLGAFLNYNELAIKHRTAAENLHSLWRDCKNWDTDFPDNSLCEKAVQAAQLYRKRLNEINRDAPQIPKWAWKSVQTQKLEGSTRYENEAITN